MQLCVRLRDALSALMVLGSVGSAQRLIPAARPGADKHLHVNPPNLRGTHFYLARNETIEAFWGRYDINEPSVEFRLAQLARSGVNYLRTWSSYRSYLSARYLGNGYGGTQVNGHWDRVKHFCDLANEYDIGVALILFNTFGAYTPPATTFTTVVGTPPAGPRIWPTTAAAGCLEIDLTDAVAPNGSRPPPGGANVNPEVELWIWGRAGGALATAPQVYRVVTQNADGADFQARVLGIVPAGLDAQNRQQFALTWQQSGRILRLVYVFDSTAGGLVDFPAIAPDSATVVAGWPSMTGTGSDLFLHTGKTKAAATRSGVVFACKGSVNFRGF